jgi:integrase
VDGPYKDRDKWRLVVFQGDSRRSLIVDTEQEAEAIKARLSALGTIEATQTIGEALEAYLNAMWKEGLRQNTLSQKTYLLKQFLPAELPLSKFTAVEAENLYARETERIGRHGKPLAAASHRAALKLAKQFFRWLVDQKWISRNPFEHIKPVGRVNVGKTQLRVDEARRLSEFLIKTADSGDQWATASLTQLVLGMRSTEVLTRRVRDLENGGTVLYIEGGKTKNARRCLKIESADLQRLLLKQVSDRQANDFLFGKRRSKPVRYAWLYQRLKTYCERAGVPRVCPHSLRGLHSTLAVEAGATSGLVASALGHSSFSITARHYVEPSALVNARLRKVQEALAPNAPQDPQTDLEMLQALLTKLPREKLAALLDSALSPNAG